MYNSTVIEQVENFKTDVLTQVKGRDVINFKLNEVSFDDKVSVKGSQITLDALKKIFKSLNVRNDFFSKYGNRLDKESWNEMKDYLRNVNSDIEFWGKKIVTSDGSKINYLYQKNELISDLDFVSTFDLYFDYIKDALQGSNIEYNVKELRYLPEHEKILIRLLDKNSTFDIFNDNLDLWKKGVDISWNPFQVYAAPFFERLICTNGVTTMEHGYEATIQNKKFNFDKIQKEINSNIVGLNKKLNNVIKDSCSHLMSNNISLNEFYDYKKFFDKKNDDGVYDHIINSVFSEKEIYQAYGLHVHDKSKKWLQTADSGRNAYQFFNDMTWLASHSTDSRLSQNDAQELQIKSSSLLLKPELDLEDIAPNVNLLVLSKISNN